METNNQKAPAPSTPNAPLQTKARYPDGSYIFPMGHFPVEQQMIDWMIINHPKKDYSIEKRTEIGKNIYSLIQDGTYLRIRNWHGFLTKKLNDTYDQV